MFDMRTVIFGYAISIATCTIVMALSWIRHRRHFTGLDLWLANFVMQFIAVLLMGSRGVLPDFVSIVIANALVIAGDILLFMGLERFVGKRTSQLHNFVLLAIFICIQTLFTVLQPSAVIRLINFSLALILVLAQSAWLMLRRVDIGLHPTTHGVGYLFCRGSVCEYRERFVRIQCICRAVYSSESDALHCFDLQPRPYGQLPHLRRIAARPRGVRTNG
jgi:hypothetical protein